MTALRIRDLVGNRSLGLEAIAGLRGLDRPIRSLHTSDLDHPARYLFPNELVLTNGLWLGRIPAREWVAEVAAAGASAIGFGLSDVHTDIPDDLQAACESFEMPLLKIPAEISFTAIADDVQARSVAGDARELRAQLARTRRLLHVLAEDGGHGGLLDVLRRETGLDAAFVTAAGRVLASVGTPPSPDEARAAARALRRGELPHAHGDRVSVFGLTSNGPHSAALVVRAPLGALLDEARLAIEQVTAYAAIEDERTRAHEATRDALGQELVDMAWRGELSPPVYLARMNALGFDPELGLSAVASSNERRVLADAAAALEVLHVFAELGGATILLLQTDDDERALAVLAAQLGEAGDEPILGRGRCGLEEDGLRLSVAEAIAAHALARTLPSGERVVQDLSAVGSHALLLAFLDRRILAAYGRSVLGRLEDWDLAHESDLVRTLQVFLENGGRWRETARALHVHPNTLRYRLGRVEALTNRRIDSTGDRVDLWLAIASRSRD